MIYSLTLIILKDSPLPQEPRIPNGNAVTSQTGRNNSLGGTGWSNGPSSNALGKPPPGRDPKSRARSRDYLKQYV